VTVSAPVELTSRPQWVGWRFVIREGPDGLPKPTKVPINCLNGSNASTTDPGTWCSFEKALAFVEAERLDGIGYVLSPDDPYTGVDLDHCRNAATGEIEEWAALIAFRLDSYTEISPSGTGLRIFVRGALPPHGRRKGHIEVYSQARFLTITGNVLPDVPERIEDRQEELSQWHLEVFGPPPSERASSTAVARMPIQLADADLLKKARSADNGEKFWALWNGDWSSSYGSRSEADLALVSHLAFYTGPDEARLDTLFRSSGLMREKWDRSGYRNSTINKALDGRTEFYGNGNLALAPRLSVNGMVHTSAGMVDTATGEVVDEDPWETLEELVSTAPDAEEPLVKGFLWKGMKHWMWSGPGVGKTMLSLALGMHVAAGRTFSGHDVEQGTVLLFESDSPRRVIKSYIKTLSVLHEIELAGLPFYNHKLAGIDMTDEEGCERVKAKILRHSDVKLIIFDACERIVPSEKYSSKELKPLTNLFAYLSETLGIALLMIDHTRKPGNGDKPDPIDLLYGGRSKGAITDAGLYLTGSIQTTVVVDIPKFRGPMQPSKTLKFDPEEGFSVKSEAVQLSDQQKAVMRVMNTHSGQTFSSQEIADEAGLKKRTCQLALEHLIEIGYVERAGESVATRYRLAGSAPQNGGGLFRA
jgi:putative DNA primase/helicase